MKSAWPAPSIPSAVPSLTLIGAVLVAIALGFGVAQYGILTLGILTVPLALGAAWWMPGIVFALYLAIPWYKASIDPLLPVDLTVGLAVLCGIASVPMLLALLSGTNVTMRRDVLALWMLPVLVVGVGAWYSVNTDQLWSDVASFVLLVWLAGLAGLRVASSVVYLRQFLVVLFGIGVVAIVTGITGLDDLGQYERVTTLGANTLGAARAALLVPLIGFTFLWSVRIAQPIVLLLTPSAIIVAVSTGSRGPLLFFLMTVLIRWLITTRGRQKAVHLGIVIVSVLVVLTVPLPSQIQSLVPQFSLERIVGTIDNVRISLQGQEADFDTSAQARIDAWSLATQLFEQRPIVGWGTSGFAEFTPSIGLPDMTYPHNLVLEIASNHGIVGLAMMALTIAPALGVALHRHDTPEASGVAALLLFSALQTLTGSSIIEDRPLWMLVAVGLGIAAQSRRPEHHVDHLAAQPEPVPSSLM